MAHSAFDTFEPTTYLALPILTARGLHSLGNALSAAAPKLRPPPVESALESVVEHCDELNEALVGRRREGVAELLTDEADLDGAGDGGWVDFRDRLRARTIYARPGFVKLAADPNSKVDYGALVERATRAAALSKRLFDAEGLSFLRTRYSVQVTATANILQIIEEDGLTDEINDVIGDDVLEVLQDLQGRYQTMVNARAARERGNSQDLKQLSVQVRQAIELYAIAVLGMIDRKKPETLGIVEDSLRPILNYRAEVRSGRSPGSDGANGDGQGDAVGDVVAEEVVDEPVEEPGVAPDEPVVPKG